MHKCIKLSLLIGCLLILPTFAHAWGWNDLWHTRDQQAAKLLQQGKATEASRLFKDIDWHAVSLYRAGNYTQAFQEFNKANNSDAQYNAGNAAAFMGDYQRAINAYNKALALNSDNKDAITNREIIQKLMDKQKKQKNDSASNNNNKNDNQNNNSADNTSSPQNSSQNNSQNANQNKDRNGNKNNINNQQAQNQSNQDEGKEPKQSSGDQKDQTTSKHNSYSNQENLRNQEENKKQILRRLAEDPGGLLRQKFMRDYLRRHTVEQDSNQGDI